MRKFQDEILRVMRESAHRNHLVLEAGTGIGKTVCALYAYGSEAIEHNKIVLYLVRTNSQQRQVILEARRLDLAAVALQGRHNLCLTLRAEEDFRTATAGDLSRACNDRKQRTAKGEEGCPYYRKLLFEDNEELRRWALEYKPTAEEMNLRCISQGICPYEFTKSLLPNVRVVIAPYVFFFDTVVRQALLRMLGVPIEDIILVVDEAHNLPDVARELSSTKYSVSAIRQAKLETERFGDPEVLEGVSVADVCDLVGSAIKDLARDYVTDEDGFLPPSAFEEYLMSALKVTSTRIKQVAMNILIQGEIIRERRRQEGKIPRSHLAALSKFVLNWFTEDGWEYVRLAAGTKKPALECWCLDPSNVTKVVNDCWSSVHMSGTLSPLEEYRDSIGLPHETRLRRYPSPFAKENRKVFVVDGVTTKYDVLLTDPEAISRIKEELLHILLSLERNTAVFFPSYDLLRQFTDLQGRLRRPLYVEEQGMNQSDLMNVVERFRVDNAILFAVYGGRLSEGLDFPARDLEVVVLVGIPYPKPSARIRAMETYYDFKFQRGWEYVIEAPAKRRLMQAIGRLIRSETDRGLAIILDTRAKRYRDLIPDMSIDPNYVEISKNFFDAGVKMATGSAQDGRRCPSVVAAHL